MACYNCGSEEGTQTRLCPACNEERRSGRPDWRSSPLPEGQLQAQQPQQPQRPVKAQPQVERIPQEPAPPPSRSGVITMVCALHVMLVALAALALVINAGALDAAWREFTERTQVEIPPHIGVMLLLIPVCVGLIHLLCVWGLWMLQPWGLYSFSITMLLAAFLCVAQFVVLSVKSDTFAGSALLATVGAGLSVLSLIFAWLASSDFQSS